MSNETNTGLPQEENWLDDILGTQTPKAELSPEELASQADEPLDMDKLMEESWDTDRQTIENIQDSVAQELPTIALEEEFTTRIPFSDPSMTVEQTQKEVVDEPTVVIDVDEVNTQADQPTTVIPVEQISEQVSDATTAIPVLGQSPFFSAAADLGDEPASVVSEAPKAETQAVSADPAFYVPSDPVGDGTQRFELPQEEPMAQHDITQQAYAYSEQLAQEPAAAAPAEPAQPEEKGKLRPEAKKGYGLWGLPHLASTLIWLTIIVVAGVSLGRMLWVCCADLMAFGKPDQQITITITAEESKTLPDGTKQVNIDSISNKLGQAGLIEYPNLFKFFAQITGKDEHIAPGTYTLNSYFDYNAMINAMSSYEKPREIVTVVIPEGYNCAQLFTLLEAYEVCTIEELEQCAANGKEEFGDYWFLTDEIPWGEKYCLEGYLFPDTYEFYTNDDPDRVLHKLLTNFDARFTDKMKENLDNINARYGLTLHEMLTIASMVEEEAVGATKSSTEYEGYNIASVYYNRLINKNGEFPTHIMGCDATVYYAMGDYFGAAGELTADHLNTDSPYNTRKYGGLPPGPITNPGSYSIYAALDPNETDYHYYVYDPEQKCHVFALTETEFNRIVAELGY